jgi:hypothetical protein
MRMLKRGSPDAARATRALAPLAIVEGAGVTARAIAALGRFAGPMAPGE